MGFNYAACKCHTIYEFVTKMCTSEGAQLDIFVAQLKHNKWDNYFKTLNWREFARNYNGSGFAKNKYDIKLQHAYLQYK